MNDFRISVRKIGFVGVAGNNTFLAMFALVALFAIAFLLIFDHFH